ncbi:hypothetical protein HPSSW114_0717, partial [Glaesserella parasuis SW114]
MKWNGKSLKKKWSEVDEKIIAAVTLSQILCKHPFQLNGDRLGDHH